MSYQKRDKGNWNCGKRCKGTRKAAEREFVAREIDEQIAEQDPNFRYKHKARHPNHIAKLEHQVEWYEQRVAEHERQAQKNKDHWSCTWANYARDALKKAKKKLEELKNAVR